MTTRRNILISLAIGLTFGLLLVTIHALGWLQVLDLKLSDLRYRIRGERTASDSIAIVEVDDATVSAYGWPIPRDFYAALLHALHEAPAGTVALDILFPDEKGKDSDQLLVSVTSLMRRLVHPVVFSSADPPYAGGTTYTSSQTDTLLQHFGVKNGGVRAMVAQGVTSPFPSLLRVSSAVGHASLGVDADGCIRRVPMLIRYGGILFPSLSLAAANMEIGSDRPPVVVATPDGIILRTNDGRGISIPTDDRGNALIDFAGDRHAFHHYSMKDVLRWKQDGDTSRLADAFGGRIVLVGNTAVGQVVSESGSTPFATLTPLLYVHANAIDAILSGAIIRPAARWAFYVAMLALALSLSWAYLRLPLRLTPAVAIAAVSLTAAGQYVLFVWFHFDSPSSFPALLPLPLYAAVTSYRLLLLNQSALLSQNELAVARDIQARLLPLAPPRREDLDIFGCNLPALEVGGDYYDYIDQGQGSLAIVLGDVSGKGVPAAILMAHLRASCHAEARAGVAPGAILNAMNLSLWRATRPESYATFFLAIFPNGGTEFRCANAGHNPALHVHGGVVDEIRTLGTPLGLFPDRDQREVTRSLMPGDLLVMYSDGITECARKGVLFGEERLKRLVLESSRVGLTAAEVGGRILEQVRVFSTDSRFRDDITLVVVRKVENG